MDNETMKKIMGTAWEYLDEGWHCSEGILKAVGEHYLGDLDPLALRLSTPFAGGVGGTNEELCGTLSGGLMVIGALYGRADAQKNDDLCTELSAIFREQFKKRFGYNQCADLKSEWVGKKGQESCSILVKEAAGLLIDVLEGEFKEEIHV